MTNLRSYESNFQTSVTIHKSLVYHIFLHFLVKFAFSLPCPNHWSKENLFTERFFLSSLYGLDMRPSQPLIYGFNANIPNDAEKASRILHQLEILSSIYYEGIIDPWKYQNKVIIHSKNVKPFEEWRFKLLTQFKDCSDGPLLFQNVRMFQIRPHRREV